jgi:hypothetical protein
MFDSPDAHANGALEFKPTVTSPGEYPSVSRGGMMSMGMGLGMGMFESPRTSGANANGLASLAQASLQSPGFGGSQHSAGGLGINDVFADLVDHDAAGLDSTQDDKDKESAEAGVRPSTEHGGEFSAMTDMDPELAHNDVDQDAPVSDSAFVATTELSPGALDNSITQQSPAPTAQAEGRVDQGLDDSNDIANE